MSFDWIFLCVFLGFSWMLWQGAAQGTGRGGVLAATLLVAVLFLIGLAAGLLLSPLGLPLGGLAEPWDWIAALLAAGLAWALALAAALLPEGSPTLVIQLVLLALVALARGGWPSLRALFRGLGRLWARLWEGPGRRAGTSRTGRAGQDALVSGARSGLVLAALALGLLPWWAEQWPAAADWAATVPWIGAWILLVELAALLRAPLGESAGTRIGAVGSGAQAADGVGLLYADYVRAYSAGPESDPTGALITCLRQPRAAPAGGGGLGAASDGMGAGATGGAQGGTKDRR